MKLLALSLVVLASCFVLSSCAKAPNGTQMPQRDANCKCGPGCHKINIHCGCKNSCGCRTCD